ncbi:4-hydroxy-tetrahydrodipicolinate reductase [Haloarcula laminariae]|uniref:4-hydroxy-tetrahydrodipicolinate reductase n=1 Tax=Haloarcula laminariae TaxID=2961577 RepID=UPI0021C98660|nr:4-hydroxy-tetrahydrodipicolinate reductase [Halomicroarcula laminariae]
MTRVAVNGAAGRMGRTVIETAAGRDGVTAVVGFGTEPDEIAGVPVVAEGIADVLTEHEVDVVVDFAVPEATLALAEACVETGVGLVVGTTGFDEGGLAALDGASDSIPLLKATNFSRGIQVLQRTVREAVRALDDYDLELMESHHNGKVDAPSGTAKSLLNVVQEERDVEPVYGREGHAPRKDDEIGVFARRAGDIRGEHELILAGNDEVLSLSHHAEDRAVFAAGALDAAAWLADREAGRYDFGEVVDA